MSASDPPVTSEDPDVSWEAVIGQPGAVAALRAAVGADEVAHAWLVLGERDVGGCLCLYPQRSVSGHAVVGIEFSELAQEFGEGDSRIDVAEHGERCGFGALLVVIGYG
jgi:hypothetical protein